jgi:hypothetical protein
MNSVSPPSIASLPGSHWKAPGPRMDGTCPDYPALFSPAPPARPGNVSVSATSLAFRQRRIPLGLPSGLRAHGESGLWWRCHQSYLRQDLDRISDRQGIQRPQQDPNGHALQFEAAWGPDGAVCVRQTRIPDLLSTDELAKNYPHLIGRIGPDCSEAVYALTKSHQATDLTLASTEGRVAMSRLAGAGSRPHRVLLVAEIKPRGPHTRLQSLT